MSIVLVHKYCTVFFSLVVGEVCLSSSKTRTDRMGALGTKDLAEKNDEKKKKTTDKISIASSFPSEFPFLLHK